MVYRLHPSPVTCLAVTDDQLIIGGSTFGNVAIADHTSGQKLGLLKSAFTPTGMLSTDSGLLAQAISISR